MKNLFHFTISLFILLSIDCFSQSGKATIFFKDGESIQGYGLIKKNKIKFKLSQDGKYDSWGYDMINKIHFDGIYEDKIYEYVKPNKFNNPTLMEYITGGEISLYQQTKKTLVLGDYGLNNLPNRHIETEVMNFLIKKGDEFPYCLNCGIFNKWKKNTINFLIDCPGLISKIKSNEYREIHLKEIVEYYNDFCTEY